MSFNRRAGWIGLVALALCAAEARADTLKLNGGGSSLTLTGGEGLGRGMGVLMLEDFDLDGIGIRADLKALSFTVEVFASTNGSDAGSLIASASATRGGAGSQWWDIDLDLTLDGGSYYVLLWRPTSSTSNWVDDYGSGLKYYYDTTLPKEVGSFKLIDGVEGISSQFNFLNGLHADLRVKGSTVQNPEPGTIVFLSLGAAGFLLIRRRRARRAHRC